MSGTGILHHLNTILWATWRCQQSNCFVQLKMASLFRCFRHQHPTSKMLVVFMSTRPFLRHRRFKLSKPQIPNVQFASFDHFLCDRLMSSSENRYSFEQWVLDRKDSNFTIQRRFHWRLFLILESQCDRSSLWAWGAKRLGYSTALQSLSPSRREGNAKRSTGFQMLGNTHCLPSAPWILIRMLLVMWNLQLMPATCG